MSLTTKVDNLIAPYFQELAESDTTIRKVFGSFMKSLSLNLTLADRFRSSDFIVAPPNRSRDRDVPNSNEAVTACSSRTSVIENQSVTYFGASPATSVTTTIDEGSVSFGTCASDPDVMLDTTKRKRNGALFGECTSSQYLNDCGPRSVTWVYDDSFRTNSLGSWNRATYTRTIDVQPTLAFLSNAQLVAIRAAESNRLNSLISQRGYRLLASALPSARQFGAFRAFAELKDLPQTVKSSLEILRNLGHGHIRIFSDSAKAYLTEEFGIAPLISDVKKLIESIDSVPRRVARLKAMNLKPATFHATQRFFDDSVNTTQLTVPYFSPHEYPISIGASNSRHVTLRATVNCVVRLPDIDPHMPEWWNFRNLYGINPRIDDIYALTPWTWLFDWFSGLGEYINVLCSLNEEPSLINYGFITGKSELTLRTTRNVRYRHTYSDGYGTAPAPVYTDDRVVGITGEASVISYRRIDASKLPDVACTTTRTGLSSWQSSILAALVASRYM